jgi:hypothetical protein
MEVNPNRIKLGMMAKDIATGLTGVVTRRVDQLSGNTQFVLQPAGDGKTAPDGHQIDHQQLEKVDNGYMDRVIEVTEPTKLRLGQKLRDMVSGHEGIATSKHTFMNGCEFFNVAGPKRDQDKDSLEYFLNVKQLELVDDGVLPKLNPKKVVRPTGGPSTRVTHAAVRRG